MVIIRRMQRTILLLVLSAICGALAGAGAGFVAADYSVANMVVPTPSLDHPATTTSSVTPATSTAQIPSLSLIPIEQRPSVPLLPPAFAKRSSSPVVSLYRKAAGTAVEDRLLTPDHLLGQAVALTADGWIVTTVEAIAGTKLADLTVWHEGIAAPVQRGIVDTLSRTVFLKTRLTGLPSAAFARIQDIAPGAAVWTEIDAEAFEPHTVVSVSGRSQAADAASSEFASRRLRLDASMKALPGTPVWDPNGSLVGLVSIQEEGNVPQQGEIIPVTSIAASFTGILMSKSEVPEISHAYLGVRTMDLAVSRIDGERGSLPFAGVLIRDEKKTGKLGVVKDSPAAKARLKAGDVIVRVDRDILDGTADLGELLSEYKPGSTVTLRVLRDAQDLDIPVTLGSIVTSEAVK